MGNYINFTPKIWYFKERRSLIKSEGQSDYGKQKAF